MSRVAVLGATSGLGREVVERLAGRGHIVLAGRRPERPAPPTHESGRITWAETDLGDLSSLENCVVGNDVLVWLAHRRPTFTGQCEIELNVEPFRHCCDHAGEWGVRRIVFVSSGGSVYGRALNIPIPEGHPRHPQGDYGKAKLAMEKLAERASQSGDVEVTILRPGNLYGQGPRGHGPPGLIGELRKCLHANAPLLLRGSADNVRDFIHVSDAAYAVASAIEYPGSLIVWNVATGVGHSVREVIGLATTCWRGAGLEIIQGEASPSDVPVNVLSIDQIRSCIAWTPLKLENELEGALTGVGDPVEASSRQ